MSYTDYANGFDVNRVLGNNAPVSGVNHYSSKTLDVVNGMNIGAPAVSGVTVLFTVPNAMSYQTQTFSVVKDPAYAGNLQTVLVSGVGCTINGSDSAVTIAALSGKTFFNTVPGTNVVVSGVTVVGISGNWISY